MEKDKIYFPVLEAEIAKRGIKKKDIAETLKISPRTFSLKITGKIDFWYKETCIIQKMFFSDMSKDELFAHKKNE